MRNDFEKWMANTENKVPGTVLNYANAVEKISQHYSRKTDRSINIYQIKDILLLKKICTEYNRGGRFEDFGNEKHGLYRAAISAYVRYFEETGGNDNLGFDEETNFSISDNKIEVKKNQEESGILYIVFNDWIRDPQTGEKPYKIGITSTSVSDRYYGLGLKMPGEFETLFAYKLNNFKEAEKAIRNILKPQHHVNGEWFNISQDEIDLVENICKTMGGKIVTDEVKQEVEIETEEDNEEDGILQPQYHSGKKDTIQYNFNGKTYGKGRLVLAIVEEYIKNHYTITLEELRKLFPKKIQGGFFVVDSLEKAMEIVDRTHRKRHFINNPIKLSNGEKIVVTTEWGISNIDKFINKARELGYTIKIDKAGDS